MGMRISTNIPSMTAQRSLDQTTKGLSKTLSQLSSGSRIVSAADDAAGLAISEKLKANIRSYRQAERNASDGVGIIQTAEGGLNEISNILIRLRELSIQSSSDTTGSKERGFSDLEFQNLKAEVERISNATEFNGLKLLNGTGQKLDFHVGLNNVEGEDKVSYHTGQINSSLEGLDLADIHVQEKESAQASLANLDSAISQVSGQRALLGATQNRLTSISSGLQVMTETLSSANSRIRDTDYAQATALNVQQNILNAAGTAVLTQANTFGQQALKLIG